MADEQKLNLKDIPKEDIARGLELLAREKEREKKIKAGIIKGPVAWKDLPEEQKKKAREADKRRLMRQKLLIQKATAKGITVSDAEVDAEMKKTA